MKTNRDIIAWILIILSIWTLICFDNVPSVILSIVVGLSFASTLGGKENE